jgi:hypothetical protein
MGSGEGRLRLLGKNYPMRNAQCAHLFTDAENEKGCPSTTQRAIICFVAKSGRVMAHEEGGKKAASYIIIVEIFRYESPLPVVYNYRSVVTTAYAR